MAFSLTGGKGKQKSSQKETFNQTQSNTLSPRAAGLLMAGIDDLKQQTYSPLMMSRVQEFQDPYSEQVRDATMTQLAYDRDVARSGQKADFAQAGAFGDNRRGIYEAELDGQFDRTGAATLAGLNSAGFAQALAAAMAENQGRNDFSMQNQDLIARLIAQFGNEGTSTTNGTSSGSSKGSNTNLGFSFSPYKKG